MAAVACTECIWTGDGTWGCFELTGTYSVIPAPRCDDTHNRLVHTAFSSSFHWAITASPLVPRTPVPRIQCFVLPLSCCSGFGEKKRAGIFLSIPPGSLFFTLFFSPHYYPPSHGARVFLPYHSSSAASCPDTAIFFFFTQDSRWRWLAERRDQGKKSASRARPGGDSANHLSKQDRLFYSGVYFYFILFHLFFFSALGP